LAAGGPSRSRAAPASIPQTATTLSRTAITAIPPTTASSRAEENGSSSAPAEVAVTTKPAIIISQTMVAAAARRLGATVVASSAKRLVPAAPTPTPISPKAATVTERPSQNASPIQTVPSAARYPPPASTAIPPRIHGVRRPPASEPNPQRGRSICTA